MRRSLGWTLSCLLALTALAEMVLDDQGAKPVRTVQMAKSEAKPEDFA